MAWVNIRRLTPFLPDHVLGLRAGAGGQMTWLLPALLILILCLVFLCNETP